MGSWKLMLSVILLAQIPITLQGGHHEIICGGSLCTGPEHGCGVFHQGKSLHKACVKDCKGLRNCDPRTLSLNDQCCCPDQHCMDRVNVYENTHILSNVTCPSCNHDRCYGNRTCNADQFCKIHHDRIIHDSTCDHKCHQDPRNFCCKDNACVHNALTSNVINPVTIVPCVKCDDFPNHCEPHTKYCHPDESCMVFQPPDGRIHIDCRKSQDCSHHDVITCCHHKSCIDKYLYGTTNTTATSTTTTTTTAIPTTSNTQPPVSCSDCTNYIQHHCLRSTMTCQSGEKCLVVTNSNSIVTKCINGSHCNILKSLDAINGGITQTSCCDTTSCYVNALLRGVNGFMPNNPVPTTILTTLMSTTTNKPTTTTLQTTTPAQPSLSCPSCTDAYTGQCNGDTSCSAGYSCMLQTDHSKLAIGCREDLVCALEQIDQTKSTYCCKDSGCITYNLSTLIHALHTTSQPVVTTPNANCQDHDDVHLTCSTMDNNYKICAQTSGQGYNIALSKCPRYCGLCNATPQAPVAVTTSPNWMLLQTRASTQPPVSANAPWLTIGSGR